MTDMREMLTIKETAKEFGISEYSLRIGIKQRKYPAIRVGGKNGKFLINVHLFAQCLEREALGNLECEEKHNNTVIRRIEE